MMFNFRIHFRKVNRTNSACLACDA